MSYGDNLIASDLIWIFSYVAFFFILCSSPSKVSVEMSKSREKKLNMKDLSKIHVVRPYVGCLHFCLCFSNAVLYRKLYIFEFSVFKYLFIFNIRFHNLASTSTIKVIRKFLKHNKSNIFFFPFEGLWEEKLWFLWVLTDL